MSDELLDAVRAGNARDIDWKELVEQLERIPALRLSLAQAQADVAKLRSWLKAIAEDDRGGAGEVSYDEFAYKRREAELQDAARKALATPADDGALREFMLRAIAESDKWGEELPESVVARVIGGA